MAGRTVGKKRVGRWENGGQDGWEKAGRTVVSRAAGRRSAGVGLNGEHGFGEGLKEKD